MLGLTSSLLPKDVTRVTELIRRTGCDGTGIVVAVLDTGVDPGAPGMQHTSSGQPKVIDVVDCTGSGDVDTSTVACASPEHTLSALSGRTLHLPDSIRALNPSGEYRLGIKHGYDFFPTNLVKRLRKERRASWDKKHRTALRTVRRRLSALRDDLDPSAVQAELEEFEARQSVLLSAEKNYRDVGPVYDCVLFHDGSDWRVVVDTSERGALHECEVLEDYRFKCRYGEFGKGVMMHFAVNVHEEGSVLSIVVDGGSHGTHVAGILAAHFPDAPHLDGLAPGAQIVSLKIGDSRLSSMETHQGTSRALAYLMRHSEPEGDVDAQGDDAGEKRVSSFAPSAKRDIDRSGTDNISAEGGSVCSNSSTTASHSTTPCQAQPSIVSQPESNQGGSAATDSKGVDSPGRRRARRALEGLRIDVANMSFGEHSRDVNKGRFVQLVNKLVYKHNVMFLSSAGNDGPALSSVSAPGGTTEAIVGVGAYVTPTMLTQAYSLLDSEFGSDRSGSVSEELLSGRTEAEKGEYLRATTGCLSQCSPHRIGSGADIDSVRGIPYTWSSRGPASDGAMGVSICAPGGAIAPVPVWTVRKKMLMNGTSMSSPSAAGAVTVILSFLKHEGISYTSSLVRRAVESTARPLKPPRRGRYPDEQALEYSRGSDCIPRDSFDSEYYRDLVFAVGNGSIDAMAACEYLKLHAGSAGAQKTRPHFGKQQDQPPLRGSEESSDLSLSKLRNDLRSDGENGPIAKAQIAASVRKDAEGRKLRIEEWQVRVRVEDGSPARRSSSNPGCGSLNTTRGIYLRGESDTSCIHRASVSIDVVVQDENCSEAKRAVAGMEVSLALECLATWVEVPSSLVLLGGGRSFPVCVDPLELESGRAHFAEITAHVFDGETKSRISSPLFRVPVTVHKPEPLVNGVMINPLRGLRFSPGSVIRRFYEVPIGASYGLLKVTAGRPSATPEDLPRAPEVEKRSAVQYSEVSSLRASPSEDVGRTPVKNKAVAPVSAGKALLSAATSAEETAGADSARVEDGEAIRGSGSRSVSRSGDARNFEAHIVQVSPQTHCGELETRHFFTMRPGAMKDFVIRVKGGCTMELCLAQMWSSPGLSVIENVDLTFGGISPQPSALHGAAGATSFPRVEVANNLLPDTHSQQCSASISGYSPRGSLTHLQRVVAPQKSRIRSLSSRDELPEVGPICQLQLDYAFEVFDSSSSVRLLFPGLNRNVYESEVEGGPFVMIYDQNKQYMSASDIYPSEVTLNKGEYTAVAYIRHDEVEILEGLQELKLTVEYEIGELHVDAYDTAHGASLCIEERRASKGTAALEIKERRAFYFSVPKKSILPKWVALGDTAVGKMYVDRVLSSLGNSLRRGSDIPAYPLSLAIGPTSSAGCSKTDSSKSNAVNREKKVEEEKKAYENSEGQKSPSQDEEGKNRNSLAKSENLKLDSREKIGANPDQWFEEAVRKLKLRRLRSLLKDGKHCEFDKLHKLVADKYPDDIEIAMLRIESLDVRLCAEFRESRRSESFVQVKQDLVSGSNNIIERLGSIAIATHFGTIIDPESSEESSRRRKFEVKRSQLIEVLFRRARALLYGLPAGGNDSAEERNKIQREDGSHGAGQNGNDKSDSDLFDEGFKELGRWVALDGKGSLPGSSNGRTISDGSTTNEDLLLLVARREVRRDRLGVALRCLDGYYGSPPSRKTESIEIIRFREDLFRKLGWMHLEEREMCSRVVRFPHNRALF